MEGVRVFSDADYARTIERYVAAAKTGGVNVDHIDLSNVLGPSNGNTGSTIRTDQLSLLNTTQKKQLIQYDLKELLLGLSRHLFGENVNMKWREDFFPFTSPSFELDIEFLNDGDLTATPASHQAQGPADESDDSKWLEVLGCGVIHDDVMQLCRTRANLANVSIGEHGWAFGLGG